MAIDQKGRVSFNLFQHHRSHAQALLFYTFDMIVFRGKSLVSVSLEKKPEVLDQLFEDLGRKANPMGLSETIDATPQKLIRVVKEFGFEKSSPSDDSLYEFRQTKRSVG